MVVLAKKAGAIGLTGKATGRVDFRDKDFIEAIETKGYRLAWSRASYCPCDGVNEQTDQPDPNCTLCEGSGWLMFAPANATINKNIVGKLNSLQTKLVQDDKAAVIRGIMTSITSKENPYDQVFKRLEGSLNLTVRPENRLGYHDRITNLDTTITYSQIEDTDGTATTKPTYPVVCMNLLRSEDQVYVEGTDFTLVDGTINWLIVPPENTHIAMHYLCHPTWRVVEHPHATRSTLTNIKGLGAKKETPLGNSVELPIQAVVKYEFIK